jgi:hypothetical protein
MAGQSPSKDGRLSTPYVPAIHAVKLARNVRCLGSLVGVDARHKAGMTILSCELAQRYNHFLFPEQRCVHWNRNMGRQEHISSLVEKISLV